MVKITQNFGPASPETRKWYSTHYGVDLVFGNAGTPIPAFVGGKITYAGDKGDGYGNTILVQDAQGNTHRYSHLRSFGGKIGDTIQKGQAVGTQGGVKGEKGAGTSTGSHLHYGVMTNGKAIDPMSYISGAPTQASGTIQQTATPDNRTALKQRFLTALKTNPKFKARVIQLIAAKKGKAPTQGYSPSGTGNRLEDYFGQDIQAVTSNPIGQSVINFFKSKGYDDRTALKMGILAKYESGLRPLAHNTNKENSVGLFQINVPYHRDKIAKYVGKGSDSYYAEKLKDPQINMMVANDIFQKQSFAPWSGAQSSIKTVSGIAGNKKANLADLI